MLRAAGGIDVRERADPRSQKGPPLTGRTRGRVEPLGSWSGCGALVKHAIVARDPHHRVGSNERRLSDDSRKDVVEHALPTRPVEQRGDR